MKKLLVILVLMLGIMLLAALPAAAETDNYDACWGQATAAYAALGVMGEHASEQTEPRAGLANLARYMYDEYGIGDGSLQALAAYLVSIDDTLTVEACM